MKNLFAFIFAIIYTQHLAAQWVPAVPYYPANIYMVNCATSYNGNIVIGGPFSDEFSGCNFERVAMWNGSEWTDIGGGIPSISPNFNKEVKVLAEFNGELYAGGCFHNWDTNISGIAKFNGTEWQRVSDSLYSNCVYAMQRGENALYVGGMFTHIISNTEGTAIRVLKIDSNGIEYIPFDAMYTSDVDNPTGRINCIAEYNGEIYIGGTFMSQDNPNM